MPERERSPHLPPLPELYPRTEFVPATASAATDEAAAPAGHTPPVDVGPQTSATVGLPTPTGEATPDPETRERERVQLTGRLGQDPRVRTTPKGTLIAQ